MQYGICGLTTHHLSHNFPDGFGKSLTIVLRRYRIYSLSKVLPTLAHAKGVNKVVAASLLGTAKPRTANTRSADQDVVTGGRRSRRGIQWQKVDGVEMRELAFQNAHKQWSRILARSICPHFMHAPRGLLGQVNTRCWLDNENSPPLALRAHLIVLCARRMRRSSLPYNEQEKNMAKSYSN